VVEELKKRGMEDVLLFAGGIIPQEDVPALERLGFRAIFGPGASIRDIVEWVEKNALTKGAAAS